MFYRDEAFDIGSAVARAEQASQLQRNQHDETVKGERIVDEFSSHNKVIVTFLKNHHHVRIDHRADIWPTSKRLAKE